MARRTQDPGEKLEKRRPDKKGRPSTSVSPDSPTRITPDDEDMADPEAVTAVNLTPIRGDATPRKGARARPDDGRGRGTDFDLRPGSMPEDPNDIDALPTLVLEGDPSPDDDEDEDQDEADDADVVDVASLDEAHPRIGEDAEPELTDPTSLQSAEARSREARALAAVAPAPARPPVRREPPRAEADAAVGGQDAPPPRLPTQVVHVPVDDEGPQVVAAAPVSGTQPAFAAVADDPMVEEVYLTKWRVVPAGQAARPLADSPGTLPPDAAATPIAPRPPQRLQTVLWADGDAPAEPTPPPEARPAVERAPGRAEPVRTMFLQLPPESATELPMASAEAGGADTAGARAAVLEAITLVKAARIHAAGLAVEDARGMNASLAAAIHRLEAALAALDKKS